MLRAPRTELDERHSRIRLPPWVFDGKALAGPGMKDARIAVDLHHLLLAGLPAHLIPFFTINRWDCQTGTIGVRSGTKPTKSSKCQRGGLQGVIISLKAHAGISPELVGVPCHGLPCAPRERPASKAARI